MNEGKLRGYRWFLTLFTPPKKDIAQSEPFYKYKINIYHESYRNVFLLKIIPLSYTFPDTITFSKTGIKTTNASEWNKILSDKKNLRDANPRGIASSLNIWLINRFEIHWSIPIIRNRMTQNKVKYVILWKHIIFPFY